MPRSSASTSWRHTGKFHTSWGEFGGFKHPACARIRDGADGGAGRQVPRRRPAPSRRRHQPRYLCLDRAGLCAHREARALSRRRAGRFAEIAILSAEYFHRLGARNNVSDDGAAQMLHELKRPFDVIDPSARFGELPAPDPARCDSRRRRARSAAPRVHLAGGGKMLLQRNQRRSMRTGASRLPAGIERAGPPTAFYPTYLRAGRRSRPRHACHAVRHVWRWRRRSSREEAEVLGRDRAALFQPDLPAFLVAPARAGRSRCAPQSGPA